MVVHDRYQLQSTLLMVHNWSLPLQFAYLYARRDRTLQSPNPRQNSLDIPLQSMEYYQQSQAAKYSTFIHMPLHTTPEYTTPGLGVMA